MTEIRMNGENDENSIFLSKTYKWPSFAFLFACLFLRHIVLDIVELTM